MLLVFSAHQRHRSPPAPRHARPGSVRLPPRGQCAMHRVFDEWKTRRR
jgi:hypothetical protein